MNGDNDMNYDNTFDHDNTNNGPMASNDDTMSNNNNNNSNNNNNNEPNIELRTIFFGNLMRMCNVNDIEDVFKRPIAINNNNNYSTTNLPDSIEIDRIDLKAGFGFVFMKPVSCIDDRDILEKYVEDLNGMEVPNVSKQLRSELARGDGRIKRKEDIRRANILPNETLFVVNFHEETTRKEDLEMLFSPYGELVRIDMKNNYAFVQFATTDQAKRAKDATNGGKLDQSVITVEYVARRDNNRDRDYHSRRSSDQSPNRYDRRNNRSPPHRYHRDDRSPPRRGRSPDRFRDRDFSARRSRHSSPDRSSRYNNRGGGHSPSSSRRDRSSPDHGGYRRKAGGSRSRSRSPFNHRRGGGKFRGSPPRDSHRNRDRYNDRPRDFDRRDRGAGFRSDDRGYAGRDNDMP